MRICLGHRFDLKAEVGTRCLLVNHVTFPRSCVICGYRAVIGSIPLEAFYRECLWTLEAQLQKW